MLQSAISRKSSQSIYCQKITVLFAVSAVLHSFEMGRFAHRIHRNFFVDFVSCVQTDNKMAESIRIWTVGRLSPDYIYFVRLFRYFCEIQIGRFSLKIENDEYRATKIILPFNRRKNRNRKCNYFFFPFFIRGFSSFGSENLSVKLRSTFDRLSIFLIPISNNFVISIFQKLQIKLIN